jgi:TolB-like protein/Tfp pilus assembly protein PilF
VAKGRSFIAELKRRNVLRAGVLYAGAVWAISQGVAQLTPALGLPDHATRWLLIACTIGFPFWIVFAWFYEFTPHGFQRDSEMAADAPARDSNARKLDFAIIGVLLVAVVLLASGYFVRRNAPAGTDAATAAFHPPADTIVVLPFANLGGNPKQQYFSDGITEELTNALGQNTGLKVIAWDTASKFRDSKQSAADIARKLNVANVLTGKILRQGDEVRVIVELVNADDGYQVWSHHYDDNLKNIFAVQDNISAAISGALKVKFAVARAAKSVNPQAHDLVLQARALIEKARSAAPFEQARVLLEQAITLAPGYADAHALLARTLNDLTQYSTLSLKDALPKVRAEANQALQLDPHNVDAVLALASADMSEGRNAEAHKGFQRAIELDPSNAIAHMDYAILLPPKQALTETLEAVRLDPESATAQNNLATIYLNLGEYAQALAPSLALARMTPHSAGVAFGLAQIYALLHRNQDAVKAFDLAQPDTPLGKQLVAAGKLAYQSVQDPKLQAQALAAANALRKRSDLDPDSLYNLFAVYLVLDKKDIALNLLDRSCMPAPFACSDFAVNPTYIPLRGDPRFEALENKYAAPSPSAASTAAAPAVSTATATQP